MKFAGVASWPKQNKMYKSASTMSDTRVLYCWITLVLLSDIVPLKMDFALYLKPENSVYIPDNGTGHLALFFSFPFFKDRQSSVSSS